MKHVFWVLEANVKVGESENLQRLLHEMVESTKAAEPDTLHYEWFIDSTKERCHVYERYANSAAVMTHLQNFGAKFADRFQKVLDVTSFTIYGNPSAEVKAALQAFTPATLTLIGGFAR